MAPYSKQAQFIVWGVGFIAPGQNEKNMAMMVQIRAKTLAGTPNMPSFQGPYLMSRMRAIGGMYEPKKPATTREMRALKASVEPILMRARRRVMTVVTPIETSGSLVRGST